MKWSNPKPQTLNSPHHLLSDLQKVTEVAKAGGKEWKQLTEAACQAQMCINFWCFGFRA